MLFSPISTLRQIHIFNKLEISPLISPIHFMLFGTTHISEKLLRGFPVSLCRYFWELVFRLSVALVVLMCPCILVYVFVLGLPHSLLFVVAAVSAKMLLDALKHKDMGIIGHYASAVKKKMCPFITFED